MQLDERTYHLINQYLAGELIGTALDAFKARLKDPEFKEQVETQQQIIAALNEVREEELRALLKRDNEVKYFQNQWGNKWTYASAAIVILFVSAFFIMRQFVDTNQSVEKEEVTSAETADETITPIDTTVVDSNTIATNVKPPAAVSPPQMEVVEDNAEVAKTYRDQDSLDLRVLEEAETEVFADEEEPRVVIMKDEIKKVQTRDSEVVAARSNNGVPENGAEVNIRSKELLSTKTYTVIMLSPTFYDSDDSISQDSSSYKTRNIQVEYWNSPINFKGYNHQSNTLKLYGIPSTMSISFKELDNRLYIRMGSQHYFINKNGLDNKFVPVSNKTLLKVLNE